MDWMARPPPGPPTLSFPRWVMAFPALAWHQPGSQGAQGKSFSRQQFQLPAVEYDLYIPGQFAAHDLEAGAWPGPLYRLVSPSEFSCEEGTCCQGTCCR